jgi:hypothetical protein
VVLHYKSELVSIRNSVCIVETRQIDVLTVAFRKCRSFDDEKVCTYA